MFDIRDSNIEGQGVFASENIKKDCIIGPAYELIGQVNGKYIDFTRDFKSKIPCIEIIIEIFFFVIQNSISP